MFSSLGGQWAVHTGSYSLPGYSSPLETRDAITGFREAPDFLVAPAMQQVKARLSAEIAWFA